MEQPPRERVAENLRALLARRRMSHREFSATMRWSVAGGHRRLNGDQPMTLDEVTAVARALDVPLTELFDGVDLPAPATERSA